MRKHLALLALAAFTHASAGAATYQFTGATYNNFTPFTAPCATPACADFGLSMTQTGSFTTNTPLAGNLANANITSLITSYSFNDGLTQYTSGGSNDKLVFAHVWTDGAGDIVAQNIVMQKWQSANHGANGRLDTLSVDNSSVHNGYCVTPAISSGYCSLSDADASTSLADGSGGAWSTSAAPVNGGSSVASVPTLGEWSLLLLSALMAGMGALLRRKAP